MSETPRVPNPAPKVKAGLSKFKGLPPWAYVAAVGVGGAAIWFGINRSKANAEADAADLTGDYSSALSATSAGEAYPVGSQGAGYYYDPGTGTKEDDGEEISDRDFLLSLLPYMVGGGTQPSANPADHYVPPAINVYVPEAAAPQPQYQPPAPAAPAPSPHPTNATVDPGNKCKGEYPWMQPTGSRAGVCYKIVMKNGKRYKYYANGDIVLD